MRDQWCVVAHCRSRAAIFEVSRSPGVAPEKPADWSCQRPVRLGTPAAQMIVEGGSRAVKLRCAALALLRFGVRPVAALPLAAAGRLQYRVVVVGIQCGAGALATGLQRLLRRLHRDQAVAAIAD